MSRQLPSCETPILFVIFNRADTAEKVFKLIRRARPQKLFVAADGPRNHKEGEAEACERARAVIQVDWECELKTQYHDQNLGCRNGMASAIDWFFNHVEEGIILEDDCVFGDSFLPYCAELLSKYRQDPRVMMVCGSNFEFGSRKRESSYYFSHIPHVWGWATWKRAWSHFDLSMPSLETMLSGNWLEHFCGSRRVAEFWKDRFLACKEGRVDAWSYAWIASIWSQSAMTTIASSNLISNIGFGQGGTNTKRKNRYAEMPIEEISLPVQHPEYMMRDFESDLETSLEHYILRTKIEKAYRRGREVIHSALNTQGSKGS